MKHPPAISVRHVGRRFGSRDVLKSVSLELAPGDVFVLLGQNGSGKTTLVEILATLLHPSSGSASVLGHDVVRAGADARASIGYAPSSLQSFYPRLTGLHNLEFFGALYGVDARSLRGRATCLLERLSLRDAAGERVERYSDGMKARLSIARALLTDPPVLLLDEPTKSLDAEGREQARQMLVEEARGIRTVVWVTHDEAEATALSARSGRLEDGRIQ